MSTEKIRKSEQTLRLYDKKDFGACLPLSAAKESGPMLLHCYAKDKQWSNVH